MQNLERVLQYNVLNSMLYVMLSYLPQLLTVILNFHQF